MCTPSLFEVHCQRDCGLLQRSSLRWSTLVDTNTSHCSTCTARRGIVDRLMGYVCVDSVEGGARGKGQLRVQYSRQGGVDQTSEVSPRQSPTSPRFASLRRAMLGGPSILDEKTKITALHGLLQFAGYRSARFRDPLSQALYIGYRPGVHTCRTYHPSSWALDLHSACNTTAT